MSRNVLENDDYILAWGQDYQMGKFVQVYSKGKGGMTNEAHLVGLNEKENGMTLQDLILTAEVFGFDLSDQGKNVERIKSK